MSSIFLVRIRAMTSLGPPGAKPMTSVIGFSGKPAAAGAIENNDASNADNRPAQSLPTHSIGFSLGSVVLAGALAGASDR
jgi:hypothetical protein